MIFKKLFSLLSVLALTTAISQAQVDVQSNPERALLEQHVLAQKASKTTTPTQVFTYVERMPEAPYDLQKYLGGQLRYPPKAIEEGIEGRVVIKVIINEEGRITDPVVERSASKELDAEALRVVKTLPNWKPARQNGKPVSVYYRIPVMFKIQ